MGSNTHPNVVSYLICYHRKLNSAGYRSVQKDKPWATHTAGVTIRRHHICACLSPRDSVPQISWPNSCAIRPLVLPLFPWIVGKNYLLIHLRVAALEILTELKYTFRRCWIVHTNASAVLCYPEDTHNIWARTSFQKCLHDFKAQASESVLAFFSEIFASQVKYWTCKFVDKNIAGLILQFSPAGCLRIFLQY